MRLRGILTALVLHVWMIATAHSQALDAVPPRTDVALGLLQAASFSELQPGLDVLTVKTVSLSLTVFRIDQRRFRFDIAAQLEPDGERVDAFGIRAGAVLAVNGGFFGEKEPEKGLFSVGLLRINGKDTSPNWNTSGGYLLFGKGGVSIAKSRNSPPSASTILQSKPLVIAPGGIWSMNTNQEIWRPRSLVCLLPDGKALLVVISGVGMSLFEAGWLLRTQTDGGFFGCDSALALDGGGSTQLWVAARDDLRVHGETAVHNALVLQPRQ